MRHITLSFISPLVLVTVVLLAGRCHASHPGSYVPTQSLKDLVIGVLVQDDEREKAYVHGALEFASASLRPDITALGYNFKFVFESSGPKGCSELLSVGGAAKLLNTHKARAIIGPVCSDGCIPAGLVANYENSPIISYGCSSSSLSDPYKYPTFARTKPYARTAPEYLESIIKKPIGKFEWRQIAVLYSTDEKYKETFNIIKGFVEETNTTLLYPLLSVEAYDKERAINILKEQSRIIFMLLDNEITAEYLTAAFESDMYNGDYAFITLDFHYQEEWKKKKWYRNDKAFQGILNIGVNDLHDMEDEPMFKAFFRHVDLRIKVLGYKKNTWNDTRPYEGAVYAYDAIKALVHGLGAAKKAEEARLSDKFLADTLLDKFLLLNNLTLTQMTEINYLLEKRRLELSSTTTTAPNTIPQSSDDNPVVNYKIRIPYTDPLWMACEAADGADLPPEPPQSSCNCVRANWTVANNDTVLVCNCSFALMAKCSKFQYSFKLPNVISDDGAAEATADCGCELTVLETLVPNHDEHHDEHSSNQTNNSTDENNHSDDSHSDQNTATTAHTNGTHGTNGTNGTQSANQTNPFNTVHSLIGNCTCIVPAPDRTELNTEWWSRNWTFPDNWNYTLNGTFPKIDYSYEDKVNMEALINDGRSIMKYIYGSSFSNYLREEVNINNEGDRFPTVTFDNLYLSDASVTYRRIFEYEAKYPQKGVIDYTSQYKVVWPGGLENDKGPLSIPLCGWKEELCEEIPIDTSDIIVLIIAPIGGLAALIFVYRFYRKQQYEKDLMNQDMIFKFNEGELEIPALVAKKAHEQMEKKKDNKLKKQKGHQKADLAVSGGGKGDASDMELIVPPDPPVPPVKETKTDRRKRMAAIDDVLAGIGNMCKRNNCQNFKGKFRMDQVFVKRIPKTNVMVERDILIEMKQVRDLKHPNLNAYLGFCLGPPYVLILSIYCNKGTLQDILTNPDIQIDWVFRNTFITDIICGLSILHESELLFHGHLNSYNILVDNRWNCKLTDYGLFGFKDTSQEFNKNANVDDEEGKYDALLWTSPENINFPHPLKTKEGDIYALGIIIAEIINRERPFSSYSQYTSRDFVHFVHKRCIPPFRPHVQLQAGLDGRTLDLMRLCWDEFPENRPHIQVVKTTFKNIIKNQESNNLLDNMIEMMEKYAHNLEMDVHERTKELMAEKAKADKLFFRALPKSIAEKMRKGETIEATTVQIASVLVVKIDEFSQFNVDLEAQQVVDLLNDFQKVVNTCLKEEENCHLLGFDRGMCTIVCGMPDPIKVRHAHYLARLSVRIMGQLTTFRFRHIQDTDMRFKMGLHSGQFNCGIVGLQTPVFSCMGLEMDKVEAMAAHCPPLKIYVSGPCKKFLDSSLKSGLFENCGPILLKGIGVVNGCYLKNIRSLGVKLRNPNSYKPKAKTAKSAFANALKTVR